MGLWQSFSHVPPSKHNVCQRGAPVEVVRVHSILVAEYIVNKWVGDLIMVTIFLLLQD